ncbi:hypothetical protein [Planctomicrobium sp. SH664]|uniref:hypothetical protein n=1 Tax=Planctomicrobium sp. SH664 TaxID=3448125 RepID=UPI003F5B91C1
MIDPLSTFGSKFIEDASKLIRAQRELLRSPSLRGLLAEEISNSNQPLGLPQHPVWGDAQENSILSEHRKAIDNIARGMAAVQSEINRRVTRFAEASRSIPASAIERLSGAEALNLEIRNSIAARVTESFRFIPASHLAVRGSLAEQVIQPSRSIIASSTGWLNDIAASQFATQNSIVSELAKARERLREIHELHTKWPFTNSLVDILETMEETLEDGNPGMGVELREIREEVDTLRQSQEFTVSTPLQRVALFWQWLRNVCKRHGLIGAMILHVLKLHFDIYYEELYNRIREISDDKPSVIIQHIHCQEFHLFNCDNTAIISARVTVRSTPRKKGMKVATLHRGEIVWLSQRNAKWSRVQWTERGMRHEGWVKGKHLRMVQKTRGNITSSTPSGSVHSPPRRPESGTPPEKCE